MIFSQIKIYEKGGNYKCVIYHDNKKVESGWHRFAPDAYSAAECKLVYKPGYVQRVPVSEYKS